jgi:5-methylcytosine-specific restriction endonuclease McrA
MVRQKVPDIEFGEFMFGEIEDLFNDNKIKINPEYQRSDMWKPKQKVALIESIDKRYSMGVLVLFINSKGQYEILDGQQRLLAIRNYIKDKLDLGESELSKYSELSKKEKLFIDSYCIYYLKLKSFDEENKEEDIVQTFLRLQEGSPLNKAEKINACRGKFKDTFRELRENHQFFNSLSKDKRFRWRLLSAEFLLLELEGNFDRLIFPGLDLQTFLFMIKKYEKKISDKKIRFLKGNLDMLNSSLNVLLSALQPRELVSLYLLISYLRKKRADNSNLINEFAVFSEDFLKNLNRFSIYDQNPPRGMGQDLFKQYKSYKEEARKATSSDSIISRIKFLRKEFQRLYPFIEKDKVRLHDIEQKRILYFRQKGICPECKKKFKFEEGSSHHVIAHSKGGRTKNLDKSVLLHEKCHEKLEKKIKKKK